MRKIILFIMLSSIAVGCGGARANPTDPSEFQQHAASGNYADVPYAKLGSETFVADYAGRSVHFKAMFIGEWTEVQAYKGGGIDCDDRIFVNHRDLSYSQTATGLGGSDMGFPEFALSIPKSKSDIVYQLKRGNQFEVWGKAEEAGLPGKRGLHVLADRMVQVNR